MKIITKNCGFYNKIVGEMIYENDNKKISVILQDTHCQFTLSENKFIFRDLQRLWMKKKPHRPLCRWKALGLLFHFVITLLKKN